MHFLRYRCFQLNCFISLSSYLVSEKRSISSTKSVGTAFHIVLYLDHMIILNLYTCLKYNLIDKLKNRQIKLFSRMHLTRFHVRNQSNEAILTHQDRYRQCNFCLPRYYSLVSNGISYSYRCMIDKIEAMKLLCMISKVCRATYV